MSMQFWVVGLSNTIHLLATIIWIGWCAALPLLLAPRAAEAHGSGQGWPAMLLRRGQPIAYGALAALGATGMLQMGASPHYEGMFVLSNLWSGLLLAKHLLILASIAIIVVLGQSVSPRLRLAARQAALGKPNRSARSRAAFELWSG